MAVGATEASLQEATRRVHGRYYTPSAIARQMLARSLRAAKLNARELVARPIQILDPACGDGAFLLAAFDKLARRVDSVDERIAILRTCLFGVDTDADALDLLRRSLINRIAPRHRQAKATLDAIESNIQLGDALTGRGFGDATVSPRSITSKADCVPPLDFANAFPDVARSGGFDLVIGNPPYRRELNAREHFQQIAESEFGQRWKQARMDLWYYFLHRGLDLLKPGGRLSFIVNSYWMASTGASLLVKRLQRETTFEEVILLGDARVFDGVAGKHMIFRLLKGRHETASNVIDFPQRHNYRVSQSQLFDRGKLLVQPPSPWIVRLQSRSTLGERFDVRQGMAENPPFVTRKAAQASVGAFRAGEGVFVLTHDEIEALQLSTSERRLLRPYFAASSLERHFVPPSTRQSVLYLTRRTVKSLDRLPHISGHLERFRGLLERRREVRLGKIHWWELHWPREERIFAEPRILAPQMGREPRFAFAEHPTFVGFSVNLILARSGNDIPLPTLAAILNSQFAAHWFDRHAKRRGVNLEINGETLRCFPLPERNADVEKRLEALVSVRHQCAAKSEPDGAMQSPQEIELAIDEAIDRLYGIDRRETSRRDTSRSLR